MATVYSDRGFGVRAPVVFYNRCNEAAARLAPGDVDWDALFSRGVRWFHSGGIFASLSPTTGPLIIEAMKAARKAGAVTSFDLNYRAKLWNIWGGSGKAREILGQIVSNADVLVGNEEDLQQGLGIRGPEVKAESALDPAVFLGMIDDVRATYPTVKVVATTLREVHSTHRHTWSAVAWVDGQTVRAPTCELDVLDRVGGGDGFASGFFYGCSVARRRRKPSRSVGPTVPCSPPRRGTRAWSLGSRSRPLPREGLPGSSADDAEPPSPVIT